MTTWTRIQREIRAAGRSRTGSPSKPTRHGARLLCIAGAFVAGFGVMHSMVFNQIGGMLAVGNGLLPLRKAAALREAKEHRALS